MLNITISLMEKIFLIKYLFVSYKYIERIKTSLLIYSADFILQSAKNEHSIGEKKEFIYICRILIYIACVICNT